MQNNKSWESCIDISKDDKCPHLSGDREPKVIVPQSIWLKIMALTREIDTEWLGYLRGSRLQTGEWRVTGLHIPEQEVTCTTVKPIKTMYSEGVIHSHADMSSFFSPTDDTYLNENHAFSIVVNKSEDTKAAVRMALPCGALSIIEAELVIEYPAVEGVDKFINEAKKMIKEPVYSTPSDVNNNTGVSDYISRTLRKKVRPYDYGEQYDWPEWY